MIKQWELDWRLTFNAHALSKIEEFSIPQIKNVIWETRSLISHILLWGYNPNDYK